MKRWNEGDAHAPGCAMHVIASAECTCGKADALIARSKIKQCRASDAEHVENPQERDVCAVCGSHSEPVDTPNGDHCPDCGAAYDEME